MVKESIVMTVSDREPIVLGSTLRWLGMSDLSESEILIVDDNSQEPLTWLENQAGDVPIRVVRLDKYDCYQAEGNYNNPAKAFNTCLQEARGERIAIISSDVLVTPNALSSARRCWDGSFVFCPMVIDLASTMEYCGPHRTFPMPWFLYTSRQACVDAGGWDENYLSGLCFEDNDFIGRLALKLGKIVCDWTSIVWHQSHYQPAYVQDAEVKLANKRNEMLTMDKWTGIPFGDKDQVAFEIRRTRHEGTGHLMLEFKDIKGVWDRVYSRTLSPFVTPA